MYEGGKSKETYLAGAGTDVASMVERTPEVHCYISPIYS